MEAAFPDREQFARYMRLLSDSQNVATRVFPKHREMFPNGLASMYAIPPELQQLPMSMKSDYLETNLVMLKRLDAQHTTVQPNLEQQVPQPPSSAPMQVQTTLETASEMPTVTISQVPPMPESLSKGRWNASECRDGHRRATPQDFWTSCWAECHEKRTALGITHLNKHFQGKNPELGGYSKWLLTKETLLALYEAARVKIMPHQTTQMNTLKRFWKEHQRDVLELLRKWLVSGAADSLQKDGVLLAALQHIRSVWNATNFWPDHGNEVDKLCLIDSVVTEDRLLHEWAASKAREIDYVLFRDEYVAIENDLESGSSQIGAARGQPKKRKSCIQSNLGVLASAAETLDGGEDASLQAVDPSAELDFDDDHSRDSLADTGPFMRGLMDTDRDRGRLDSAGEAPTAAAAPAAGEAPAAAAATAAAAAAAAPAAPAAAAAKASQAVTMMESAPGVGGQAAPGVGRRRRGRTTSNVGGRRRTDGSGSHVRPPPGCDSAHVDAAAADAEATAAVADAATADAAAAAAAAAAADAEAATAEGVGVRAAPGIDGRERTVLDVGGRKRRRPGRDSGIAADVDAAAAAAGAAAAAAAADAEAAEKNTTASEVGLRSRKRRKSAAAEEAATAGEDHAAAGSSRSGRRLKAGSGGGGCGGSEKPGSTKGVADSASPEIESLESFTRSGLNNRADAAFACGNRRNKAPLPPTPLPSQNGYVGYW